MPPGAALPPRTAGSSPRWGCLFFSCKFESGVSRGRCGRGAGGVGGGFRGAGHKPGSRALGPAASALDVPYWTGKKPNPSSSFLRAGPCGRPPGLSRDGWRQPCPHLPFESGSEVVCGQSQLQTRGGRGWGGLWAKGPPSAEVRTVKLRVRDPFCPFWKLVLHPAASRQDRTSSPAPNPTPAGVGRPGRAGTSTPAPRRSLWRAVSSRWVGPPLPITLAHRNPTLICSSS